MGRMAIYERGASNIQTTVTNGYCDFTDYKSDKGRNLTVKEYLEILGPNFVCISLDDAVDKCLKAQTAKYNQPWKEITESEYNHALKVLPPEKWLTVYRDGNMPGPGDKGVNIFRMSEYTEGIFTAHYARFKNKYYTATRKTSDSYRLMAAEVIEMFEQGAEIFYV